MKKLFDARKLVTTEKWRNYLMPEQIIIKKLFSENLLATKMTK